MTRDEMVKICQTRDKRFHDAFFLAVKSTKVVCHPDCPTRVPLEKNMAFYDTLDAALADGYRPCTICMKDRWQK